jgi:hypothetical protein
MSTRLLSLMRHLHQDEVMQMGREFFIHRMMRGGIARVEGIAGAPFTIYYGEVSGDSDGPVEFCWPVPDDQAAEIAARFPDLTLRTEPAHQEAFVRPGASGMGGGGAEAEIAIEAMFAWASEQHRRGAALNRGAKHRRPRPINPRRTSRAGHLVRGNDAVNRSCPVVWALTCGDEARGQPRTQTCRRRSAAATTEYDQSRLSPVYPKSCGVSVAGNGVL